MTDRARRTRERVRDLDELLRLTCSLSLADLEELITDQLTVQDDLEVVVEETGPSEICVIVGSTRQHLAFPFTLSVLWRTVEALDNSAWHWTQAYRLQDLTGEQDCTRALSEFFGVSELEFARAAGSNWWPQSQDSLQAHGEAVVAWFVSGQPAQVLLGIGANYATVAMALPRRAGLAGPACVEQGEPHEVRLREKNTLKRLGRAVRTSAASRRVSFGFCESCRKLQAYGGSTPWCWECMERYEGYIWD